jgi:RHS repeat-associated protein
VYEYVAVHFNEDSDGNYTAERINTDLIGSASQSTAIDAFGKGLSDFLFAYGPRQGVSSIQSANGTQMSGKAYGYYMMKNYGAGSPSSGFMPSDMLESVTNPAGVSANWKYRPLSTGQGVRLGEVFYSPDFDYTGQFLPGNGEYLHFTSSMYTVAEFNQSNGVGGVNTTYYRYKGAVYNTKGRGFMGFRQIVEEQSVVGLITQTNFEQKFPLVGAVREQKMFQVGAILPFQTQTNDWVNSTNHDNANTAKIYHVHNSRSESETFDLNDTSQSLSTTVTTTNQSDLDQWGNVEKQTTVHTDEFGTQINIANSSFYASDAWPHKLDSSSVNQQFSPSNLVPSKHPETGIAKWSTTRFNEWDTTHRKPTQMTVAPGSAAMTETNCNESALNGCTSINTIYNDYGLPESKSVTGTVIQGKTDTTSLETRVVSYTYSDDGSTVSNAGYFPYQQTSHSGYVSHTTKVITEPRSGAPLISYDANNIALETVYDSLNRPIEVIAVGTPKQYIRYRNTDNDSPSWLAMAMISTYQTGSPDAHEYKDILGRTLRTKIRNFGGEYTFIDSRFDEAGRLTHQSNPHSGQATYTIYSGFDPLGRVTRKVTPASNSSEDFTTTYSYIGLSTTINTFASDGYNLTMHRTSNSLGQLMNTTDAQGGVTRYAYDAAGNPIVIKDAAEHKIFANYDNIGRKLWVRDPNQGLTQFTYNDFGELEKEVDANYHWQRYDYDKLGRVKVRSSSNGNASFTWDTKKKGYLSSESSLGVSKTYTYDSLARPIEESTQIDGSIYKISTEYDSYQGRPKSLTYPNGLKVAFQYNPYGYLQYEKNARSGYVYREITATDNLGNVTGSKISDGILTGAYTYNQRTGQMLSTKVDKNINTIHQLAYSDYDSYGNIKTQQNLVNNINSTDSFAYDNMHRMMASTISASGYSASINYGYDLVGNMKKKTDYSVNSMGAYSYINGTNKLASVILMNGSTETFGYDSKGNLTKRNNSQEAWYNVLNKPTRIQRLGSDVTLFYDSNWSRYKQVKIVNNQTTTTHYIGKLYEVEKTGNISKTTSYISDIALITEGNAGNKIRFTHKDRLGSSTTFTDDAGNVTAYRSYDPFGKPKMGGGRLMSSYNLSARLENNLHDSDNATTRGFTDHEHLDDVELIHMNGRVYDYNVGRFLSVDPFVHEGSQGINPYSYILNNPLSGTDPTGYAPEKPTKETMTGSRIPGVDTGASGASFGAKFNAMNRGGSKNQSNGSKKAQTSQASSATSSSSGELAITDVGAPGSIASQGSAGTSGSESTFTKDSNGTPSAVTPKEQKVPLSELLGGDKELEKMVREGISLSDKALQQFKEYGSVGVTIRKGSDGDELGDINSTIGQGLDQIVNLGGSSEIQRISPENHILAIVVERFSTNQAIQNNASTYSHYANQTGVPYIYVASRFGKSYFYAAPTGGKSSPLIEINMERE